MSWRSSRSQKKQRKTRHNKATPAAIEGDAQKKRQLTDQTREDGFEPLYRDFEQEVKDAEPEKVQWTATKKAAAAASATAALTAAADGDTITKNNAEAAEATVASEAQDKDKGEEIPALIQARKKDEKERIREVSKKMKKCIREKDGKAGKYTEDFGRTQRDKKHLQY